MPEEREHSFNLINPGHYSVWRNQARAAITVSYSYGGIENDRCAVVNIIYYEGSAVYA